MVRRRIVTALGTRSGSVGGTYFFFDGLTISTLFEVLVAATPATPAFRAPEVLAVSLYTRHNLPLTRSGQTVCLDFGYRDSRAGETA